MALAGRVLESLAPLLRLEQSLDEHLEVLVVVDHDVSVVVAHSHVLILKGAGDGTPLLMRWKSGLGGGGALDLGCLVLGPPGVTKFSVQTVDFL